MKTIKKFLLITLSVVIAVFAIICITAELHEAKVQKEIVNYLAEHTEDEGDYIIALAKCKYQQGYEGASYIAYMVDDEGDQEVIFVQYKGVGDIERCTIWWQ